MASIAPLLHIAALSAYGLRLSYSNITRLRTYEEQSEKAAEWSNTAAQRLHKTRTTQASGAISIAVSLISALTMTLSRRDEGAQQTVRLVACLANPIILAAARVHVGNFWNEKTQTKVPFVQKFNDAIRGSEEQVRVIGWLAASWMVADAIWWSGLGGMWETVVYFGGVLGFVFATGGLKGLNK